MAKLLGTICSGCYAFYKRHPGSRAVEDAILLKEIQSIYKESYKTCGNPGVHTELIERGFKCSRCRVARIMRDNHLLAKMYKKFKKTTRRSNCLINQHQA